MKNETLKYKGYEGSVGYSAEDNCLCGKVLNIRGLLSYEGQSLAELERDFKASVDDYLDSCKRRGIEPEVPFKGSFNVRVRPEIHRALAWRASAAHLSLNAYVAEIFEKELSDA